MAAALLLAVLLIGCGGQARLASPGSRPGLAERREAGVGRWEEGNFSNPAGSRRYKVYVPGSYDPTRKQMLIVLLHGCTQDADDIARGTRIAAHAEREGFLALLPEQPASAHPKKCWNWYDPAHQTRGAGEPSLIDGVTGQVMHDYAVDPARVHLAGISAGAAMASLVAVAYPERYASVALHSGLAWRAATTLPEALSALARGTGDTDALGVAAYAAMGSGARAIPALVVHGGKDVVVNAANGSQSARQWAVTDQRALGVAQFATEETSGEENGYHFTRVVQRDATGATLVEAWTVQELGHAWSGGSREGTFTDEQGPDATREMVRFFREHPRPGGASERSTTVPR